jgi:hypothetical protein
MPETGSEHGSQSIPILQEEFCFRSTMSSTPRNSKDRGKRDISLSVLKPVQGRAVDYGQRCLD